MEQKKREKSLTMLEERSEGKGEKNHYNQLHTRGEGRKGKRVSFPLSKHWGKRIKC